MAEQNAVKILVERAKGGDRGAFDELIGMYQPRLQDAIKSWRRFQIGPRMDDQELLQETFIRAFRSLSNFEWTRDESLSDESFFRWICGIAKHVLAQAAQDLRKAGGKSATALIDGVSDGGPTQSKALQRNERFDRLERALEKLRSEHREVLILSRIKGLTVKEIADHMDRSPRTVKYFIACALRELKKHFGDTESFSLPDRQLHTEGDRDGK